MLIVLQSLAPKGERKRERGGMCKHMEHESLKVAVNAYYAIGFKFDNSFYLNLVG